MKQEQNNKLLKWAGFVKTESGVWLYPDGIECEVLPDFDRLDDCFEWLIPKLAGYWLSDWLDTRTHMATVYANTEGMSYTATNAESAALALCLAISKLIEQEVDNDYNR